MIPFVDLKAQYHSIKSEIDAAISDVLENSAFILGKHVAGFEEDFARYCQTPFAIGLNSGTSALHLALLAAGVGPGDEIITVPFTFVASVAAIWYTGARPVFVDIDPGSFTMDPARVEAAITPRTKAIVPVHLYGQTADMDPILEIARRHGLTVVEDACQAHGAEYRGRRAGSMGDLGCFSFYPGKNLGAYGEGGAVVTANPTYNRTIRMLRDWGAEKKYEHVLKGFNYRLEGMQGAILRVKLRYLDAWTESRRAHAAAYHRLLEPTGIPAPREMPWARHVYHVYAIRTQHRAALQAHLNAAGVQTGIHYPIPVHLLEAYADLGYRKGDFPHSESAAEEVLSLPMFPELNTAQIEAVAAAVGAFDSRTVGAEVGR
jgi:dTDP-4-amino-4,6-dideoxygalactose transaminase